MSFAAFGGLAYGVSAAPLTYAAAGADIALHPGTLSWIARSTIKPGWLQIFAVDSAIAAMEASGAWAVLDGLYLPVAAADAASACLNLRRESYGLSQIGSPTFTPGQGWNGDGVASYLDPSVNLATYGGQYTQNSGSAFVWQLSDIPGATWLVGASSLANRLGLRGRNGQSSSIYVNDTTAGVLSGVQSGAGFLGVSRQSAASYIASRGGGFTTFATASSGLPGSLFIGRFGTGAIYDANQWAAFGFGAGLSPTQLESVHIALLALLITLGAITSDDAPDATSYSYGPFLQSQLAQITPAGLLIVQNCAPPADMTYTAANFANFPASIFSTQAIDQIVACTRTDCMGQHFIWGDREIEVATGGAYPNQRPNQGYPTIYLAAATKRECRYTYSTRARARAAWIVKQRYSAGALASGDARYADGKGWQDYATAAGVTAVPWATLNANPATYFTGSAQSYATALDVVYLPIARLADAPAPLQAGGFLRDTEDQTDLTPAELLSTIEEAATSCHATGHTLTIYNNPLNGGGAIATGFTGAINPATSNSYVYDMATAADFISLTAYPQNQEHSVQQSLADQVAEFSPAVPWAKIQMIVGIGAPKQEMAIGDCAYGHQFMVANNIKRLFWWRDYATQGGPLSTAPNQVQATWMGLPTS